MLAKSFRDLIVYRIAFEAAMRIFELSKAFPAEERYSLTDQIRRSSRSVCANIAEGWAKRRYPAAFASKLTDASAEAMETQVWSDTALRCGYLKIETYTPHSAVNFYRIRNNDVVWCRHIHVAA